jgi:sodium/bile acid cotransporter 7
MIKILTNKIREILIKHWFLVGLVFTFLVTLADPTGIIPHVGRLLSRHHGPDLIIVFVFLFSGLSLSTEQMVAGLKEKNSTLMVLGIIFILSPAAAHMISWLPWKREMVMGLFLVAVMPPTLSTGMVMTGASGGNMAHALLITIAANTLAVFTIPLTLPILLDQVGGTGVVTIDKAKIMLKIAVLIILPLFTGMIIHHLKKDNPYGFQARFNIVNQCLVLVIVWMALSQSGAVILSTGSLIGEMVLLSAGFHIVLLILCFFFAGLFRLGPGRRESVIFMGGQKTLPLSVILQVSLFPQYTLVLVFCVTHHVIHLFMDAYVVGRLKP